MALPGKASLRKLIKSTGGTISKMAEDRNVSRQTIYNWLDHYNMRDDLQQARSDIVMMAEGNVYESVADGDLDTSKWVLERKGAMRGWNKQVEISGVLGALDLTAEEMLVLQRADLDMSVVVRQFLAMLQAAEVE